MDNYNEYNNTNQGGMPNSGTPNAGVQSENVNTNANPYQQRNPYYQSNTGYQNNTRTMRAMLTRTMRAIPIRVPHKKSRRRNMREEKHPADLEQRLQNVQHWHWYLDLLPEQHLRVYGLHPVSFSHRQVREVPQAEAFWQRTAMTA